MSAFFFGPSERQLFGFHHVPRGAPAGAVVVCAPWPNEYDYAHRSLNLLGKSLAARGFHVLRFDYSGTGDSWGDSIEADPRRWVADTAAAVSEVRMMSGLERVDLVGLRLGALVATRAAAGLSDLRRLVLWDPVTHGPRWLSEIGSVAGTVGAGHVELGNTVVSRDFVEQIAAIDPEDFEADSIERVFVLTTQDDGDDPLLRLPNMVRERLRQPAPWVQDESIWTGQVPVDSIKRIVEWLA